MVLAAMSAGGCAGTADARSNQLCSEDAQSEFLHSRPKDRSVHQAFSARMELWRGTPVRSITSMSFSDSGAFGISCFLTTFYMPVAACGFYWLNVSSFR